MKNKNGQILVVDDDKDILVTARLLLKRHFALVHTHSDPKDVPELIRRNRFDVVLLDMNFALGENSGSEGLRLLNTILQIDPSAVVVLMTAYGDIETAVTAIREGATDFVLKPWQNEKLVATLHAALSLGQSQRQVEQLRSQRRALLESVESPHFIAESVAMHTLLEMVRKTAPTDANVLITGENGTGKELIAREIYRLSRRADNVLLSVDLGAIAETLFESELFGHVKGAFTDARQDRQGRFVAASGGTLFLDEIGNLPVHLQVKLLRVLEQRQVTQVGADRSTPVDVRLICATNMPLKSMVEEGTFRADLLYRINTVEIHLPPLRERTEDIPPLADYFIDRFARKYRLPKKPLTPGAIKCLQQYHWPGNVRELAHALERALILSGSHKLLPEDFALAPGPRAAAGSLSLDFETLNLEAVEQKVVERALLKHHGNISHAALELGITRTSLYRRMEKYGI